MRWYINEPGSRSSPDIKSATALILDFPASELLEIISVIYELPSVIFFVIAAQTHTMIENGFDFRAYALNQYIILLLTL